jgi:hypothetical protein
MIVKPRPTATLALAIFGAGCVLFADPPVATAGELNNPGPNQPAINSRIDQLAKPSAPDSASQPTLDNPKPGDTTGAGSFPRSFLIPGTDTSVRVGGSVDATVDHR